MIEFNYSLNKRWRYSIGVSIENTILEIVEMLVMAKNAGKAHRPAYLTKASALMEVINLKLRLLLELKLANETRIFQLQSQTAEIGRMLGGWLKAAQST